MMDDAIEINIKLGEKEISAAADRIEKKLRAALGPLFGGGPGGGGRDPITPRLRDQEAAALRLAQAQARLASVNGNLSQAQNILSTALDKTTKETVAQTNAQIQLVRVQQQMERAAQATAGAFSKLSAGLAGLAGIGVTAFFKQIAESALQSAINLDKTRQTLVALTGSVTAANAKIAELRKLAESSPGVTTTFATQLFAQLKAIGEIADTTINRVITSVGKLNAIFTIQDPQTFTRNLVQIFQGGFERDQIKEALTQVPIFEQLLEGAFGTKDPEKLRKLKQAGTLTMETFLGGLSDTINKRFPQVNESIGTQIEKTKENILTGLAPLGDELAKVLLPILKDIEDTVKRFGPTFTQVFRDSKNEIVAVARELGNVAVEMGRIVSEAAKLAGAGGFKDVLRETALMLATLGGLTSGDFSGSRTRKLAEQFFRDDVRAENEAARQARLAKVLPFGLSMDEVIGGIRRPDITPNRSGNNGGGAASAKKTEVQQLAETVKDLNREIEVLRNATGREFNLSVKADDLRDIKRTLEEIKDLRRELGLSQAPVATGQEQATLKALKAVKEGKLPTLTTAPDLFQRGARLPGFEEEFFGALPAQDVARFERLNEIEQKGLIAKRENNKLRLEEVRIQNQVQLGLLTEAEARQAILAVQRQQRDEILRALETEREFAIELGNLTRVSQIDVEIERVRLLGVELSNNERFMRGFNSQIEDSGDAFERFGQNVSRALTDTKNLLGSLKQAVRDLFNDLLGQSLQNLMRQALAPLLGGIAGAFGGPSFAGAAGNIFRTPSTFPANAGSSAFQSIANAISGGGGITAPPSISSGIGQFIGASVPRTAGVARGTIDEFIGSAVPRTAGRVGGFFSNIGQSIASAAPFLGLSLGGSLGGQSVLGQIAGSAGGFLTGGLLAAKLTTGIFSKAATAFFTNPITAIAGVGLLVGSVLLGRAAQRRKDEEASGQFLTQALQGIEELAAGVASGQIPGSQARLIFENQILGTFRQQISGLKTKSVVESRLTNQVADLRRVFEARIPPLIAEQERKAADAARFAAIDSRLVPQFAGGGTVPGIDRGRDSVLAMLRPGEKVLTLAQQSSVIAQSNPGVFDRAGVPRTAMRVGPAQAFQFGGTAQPSSFASSSGSGSITLFVQLGMTESDTQEVVARGLDSRTGEEIVVNAVQKARGRGRRV